MIERTFVDDKVTPSRKSRAPVDQKLDKVLDHLKTQQEENSKLREALTELDEKVTELQAKSFADSSNFARRVPPGLSVKVKAFHEKSSIKFDGSERYQSEHNQAVKVYLEDQLKSLEFYSVKVKRSIYWYYESRRRIHNDSQPEWLHVVHLMQKKARKVALRKQPYFRRSKVLKEHEREKWSTIDHHFMTDESDTEEDVVLQHKLVWRSEELNKLVQKLTRRLTKRVHTGFKPKERVLSEPSELPAPVGCPRLGCAIVASYYWIGRTRDQLTVPI